MNAWLAVLGALLAAGPDTVPPVVAFPEPGLDDPAAYAGYATRVYRDARGNAVQVYLNARSGRVVLLWADAADESVGFSVRDSAGAPATLAWASAGAVVDAAGSIRSIGYALDLPARPLTIGLFLMGSMRVERDFQYQGRDSLALGATPFPRPELDTLIGDLDQLPVAERTRQLRLLRAAGTAALRVRLEPRVTLRRDDSTWSVRITQASFDGRNHITLRLAGDARHIGMDTVGRTIVLRPRASGPIRLSISVSTDAAALTPLSPEEIFNPAFRRFATAVRADRAAPLRARRLTREMRGFALLAYREKLMAGLPNFATYFGRDMLMTALLMRPVWQPAMAEHVIGAALARLSPDGDVSHEEALGGQAIRENATAYDELLDVYRDRTAQLDTAGARRALDGARAVLADLQAIRQNYHMVDDDVQLPVVAAAYLTDDRVPPEEKRHFLLSSARLRRLVANLGLVARRADPYARHPVATNLVSFPRSPEGGWSSASWRDSRTGYGGGRFALDVNAIWMPRALQSLARILDAFQALGFTQAMLDSAAPELTRPPLARYARDRAALRRAIVTWQGAAHWFQVSLDSAEVRRRIAARLRALAGAGRAYWDSVLHTMGTLPERLRFPALALDSAGRPVPIVSTDPAMWLLEALPAHRATTLLAPIMLPYPVGLFVEGLGPLVANDAYASPAVWAGFRDDPYHSPRVVWGREVNILLVGLAIQVAADSDGTDRQLLEATMARLTRAVDRSGLRHAELWTYRVEDGRLRPVRYGSSSDVQLWSLTDLAVQYLVHRTRDR